MSRSSIVAENMKDLSYIQIEILIYYFALLSSISFEWFTHCNRIL
jgi:hypothetical protein